MTITRSALKAEVVKRRSFLRILSRCMTLAVISAVPAVESVVTNHTTHKNEGLSRIPWNILLDPSYTSHKATVASGTNQVVYSPPHYGQSSKIQNHRVSGGGSPASTSSPVHYQKPPTFSSNTTDTSQQLSKFSVLLPSITYSSDYTGSYSGFAPKKPSYQHQQQQFSLSHPSTAYGYGSGGASASQTTNSFKFPGKANNHFYSYEFSGMPSKGTHSEIVPKKKEPSTTRKPVKHPVSHRRRPDYADSDYFEDSESFYQDYDYPDLNSEIPNFAPNPQPSKRKKGPWEYGYDSDTMLEKAKDLLRGNSRRRPNFSTSTHGYYNEQLSPSKHFSSYDSYGPGSPFSQDGESRGKYPKDEYYESTHDVDYDHMPGFSDVSHFEPPVHHHPQKRKGSKYGTLAFALGLLPLGLLLASLVPTVVTIPVTTAVATGRRRRRSLQFVNPVLETIEKFGVTSLEDPSCLQRVFCSVVVQGREERSSIVQKLYYRAAKKLDERWADYWGLKMLLRAVKNNQCEYFSCSPVSAKRTNMTVKRMSA